jgi:hypothetical protein
MTYIFTRESPAIERDMLRAHAIWLNSPQREAFMSHDHDLNYAEKTLSLIQLDSLIPYQYRETMERKVHLEAEKRLMLAVLEDAIFCFQKYYDARNRKEQRLFQDTEAWIVDPESCWIFSFDSVCESLNLDARYIRRGLMEWKQSMLSRARYDPNTPGGRKSRSHKTRLRFAA